MEASDSLSLLTGLRCRSCRAVLFENESIFTTHTTEKKPFIKSKSSASSSSAAAAACSHYFLDGDVVLAESIKWLEDQTQTGNPEGTICCWKCAHKLGTFNWKGAQCGCGAWQIPALGIIKSKVDPIYKRSERRIDS